MINNLINNRNMQRFSFFCTKQEKCMYSFVTRTSRSKTSRFIKVCHSPYFECEFKTEKMIIVKEGRI